MGNHFLCSVPMEQQHDSQSIKQTLKLHAAILLFFLTAFFVQEIADSFLGGALNQYGIRPRTMDGLYGIVYAPFLHGDFAHLIGNTLPFVVLGWLILLEGVGHFFVVYLISSVVAGLGTWIVGAGNSVHIGASGVIFGFLGYLLLSGFFQRSLRSILVSVAVGALYGGLLFGVLPGQPGISWEGHLFGFIGGVLAARVYRKKRAHAEAQ